METLPPFLLKTIENACEQYCNVTFTVHGSKDNARISIMFSNDDPVYSKRKSKGTMQRDSKRMRKFLADKVEIPKVDVAHVDLSNIESESHVTEHKSSDMDVDNSQLGEVVDVCDEQSIVHVDTEHSVDTFENVVGCNSVENSTDEHICSNEPKCNNVTDDTTENETNRELSRQKFLTVDDVFSKIVLKQTVGRAQAVIGKTHKENLVIYFIDNKVVEVMFPEDRQYWKYNKIISKDFKDVRETNLLNSDIERCFHIMLRYAFRKRL